MQEDTAVTATANDKIVSPELANELSTEMTDAEMEAFVDKTLGIKAKPAVKYDKKDDSAKPVDAKKDDAVDAGKPAAGADESAKEEANKSTEDENGLVEAAKQEEIKPVEIPAVDSSDLWVEIEGYIVDEDGANPQAQNIRIAVGDTIPENARFKNDAQLYEVLEAQREMREELEARNAKYKADKAVEDGKITQAANQKITMDGWDAEIAELIEDGDIEAPKIAAGEPGFLEDPSTIKIDAVFKYMTAENAKRKADGKQPIQSFAVAFNRYNKQQSVLDKEAADKVESKNVKARGALVGGGSGSGGSSNTNQKVYVTNSARNIHQVDTSDL
jgi:hypothetical protein